MSRLINVLTPVESIASRVRAAVANHHTFAITGDFTPILPREDGRLMVWRGKPEEYATTGFGWQYVEDVPECRA